MSGPILTDEDQENLQHVNRKILFELAFHDFPRFMTETADQLLAVAEASLLEPTVFADFLVSSLEFALGKEGQARVDLNDDYAWIEKCKEVVESRRIAPETVSCFCALHDHIRRFFTMKSFKQAVSLLERFSNHFSRERREVGMHGIYSKYGDHSLALSRIFTLYAFVATSGIAEQGGAALQKSENFF